MQDAQQLECVVQRGQQHGHNGQHESDDMRMLGGEILHLTIFATRVGEGVASSSSSGICRGH